MLQEGRGAEHLPKNDAIPLFDVASMTDPAPQSDSRRTIFLVSISIAVISIFLTFYAPNLFQQQQHKMSPIKNVAVIGVCQLSIEDKDMLTHLQATGNLGPAVVRALLDSGFTVTALTRANSTSTVLPGVKVHKVDYSSPESIAEAFKGQDAVVSTIATAGLGQQQAIVDAAIKAGVKRFIPSEFGVDTTTVGGGAAKILEGKIALQGALAKAAEENKGFSWTGISTGMFFDWVYCSPP